MGKIKDTRISKAITKTYHERFTRAIESDVAIVGAGPAGMIAGYRLASAGKKVIILEKRLSPGGGIWGGGMAMNIAVVQNDAVELLDELDIVHDDVGDGLHTVDAMDLAAGLCQKSIRAGVLMLNLVTVEDACVSSGRVTGVVANRSMIYGELPVDPLMFSASAVLDATGHESAMVQYLRNRGALDDTATGEWPCEGPLDADAGEKFVVENAGQIYPGLWIAGMSVCAARGGPRMGPIFGGMLLSGERVADMILRELAGT